MKSGAEHLAGCLAIVELFSEQLNPLQHGRLEKEAQCTVSFYTESR